MIEHNTGGPAFPTEVVNTNDGFVHAGMTLRDYFAAKAMQAMYASSLKWESTGVPRDPRSRALIAELALDAYGIADAMLEARK